MEKRGYGHIEIVISFVLFVSVVIAVFYIIDPFSAIRDKSTNLEYIKFGIEEKTKVDVYSISIKGDENYLDDAFEVDLKDVFKGNELNNKKVVAKDVQGNSVPAKINGNGNGNGNKVTVDNVVGKDLYYLTIAKDLVEDNTNLPNNGYLAQIISIKSSKLISEEELRGLVANSNIREEINVPESMDFSFILEGKDIEYGSQNVPEGIEVYSKTYRVEVINQNGEIYFGDLTIATW